MNFSPKSPAELDEERKARMKLLKTGPADFVVKNALDTMSEKDGTEQIEMQVEVTDSDGNSKVIKDWLTPKMMAKMRNFCYGAGVGSLYDQGILTAEHCEGLSGVCLVAIEKGSLAPDGSHYPDKNKIRDYVITNSTPAQRQTPPQATPSEATAAMRKAQSAYKAKFPADKPRDELVEAWNQAVRKYFFAKKPELITAAEWARFAADGFDKPQTEAPFGENEFKEDDIPF